VLIDGPGQKQSLARAQDRELTPIAMVQMLLEQSIQMSRKFGELGVVVIRKPKRFL
jgi:hypothetical protein